MSEQFLVLKFSHSTEQFALSLHPADECPTDENLAGTARSDNMSWQVSTKSYYKPSQRVCPHWSRG